MGHLVACSACARHVRALETRCPFCGGGLVPGAAHVAPPLPRTRLGRAAMFAFGATLAATGCGDGATGTDAGSEDAGMSIDAAVYGGPPLDAGLADDAGLASDAGADAGEDAGEIFPPYGAPPADGVL